jgi:predicted NAD/FAD-binding protein
MVCYSIHIPALVFNDWTYPNLIVLSATVPEIKASQALFPFSVKFHGCQDADRMVGMQ